MGLLLFMYLPGHRCSRVPVVTFAANFPHPPVDGPRRLHVATIVTDAEHPNLVKMVQHARRHRLHIEVLMGDFRFGPGGLGWGPRLRVFRNYLNTLPPDDVVMFVDGYDVLVDAGPADILRQFDATLKGARKVLFSAECNCWPDADMAAQYPVSDSPYKYINGGTYIATVDVMRAFMDTYLRFEWKGFDNIDDQREYHKIYLSTDAIALDADNTIFNCIFGREVDLVRTPHKGWYNKQTKTYPLVFHGNGGAKKHLFDVIEPGLRKGPDRRAQS
jgi:hypothetical protein